MSRRLNLVLLQRLALLAPLLAGGCFISDSAFEQKIAEFDADGDGYPAQGYGGGAGARGFDCDDADGEVFPGAPERCNGVDDDCDDALDEGVDEALLVNLYPDGDGDEVGAGEAVALCPGTPGYAAELGDCDDGNAAVRPGATEVCNDVDDDCDEAVDEEVRADLFADGDGDGFGDGDAVSQCSGADGYADADGDCDDTDADVFPGATEVCNDTDDDCDDIVDNDLRVDRFEDEDGDGYGAGPVESVCAGAVGYAAEDGDCDDEQRAVNPIAEETCNEIDDDCDDAVDEAGADGERTFYPDADDDGEGAETGAVLACELPSGFALTATDCDDTRDYVNTDAEDTCTTFEDDDCDPQTTFLSNEVEDKRHVIEVPWNDRDENCDGVDECLDLNCDNRADLVLPGFSEGTSSGAQYTTNQRFFLSNPLSGLLSTETGLLPQLSGARKAIPGYFNGDGYVDLLFVQEFGGSGSAPDSSITSAIQHGASGGTFANGPRLPTVGATDACVGDLDGDGLDDVVFVGSIDTDNVNDSPPARVFLSRTGGVLATRSEDLPAYRARACALADLNDDDSLDVIVGTFAVGSNAAEHNAFIYWNRDGDFSPTDRKALPGYAVTKILVGDVGGGADLDVVLLNSARPNATIGQDIAATNSTVYLDVAESGGGTVSLPTQGARGGLLSDVNGDGHLDLVVANQGSLTKGIGTAGSDLANYDAESFVYWGAVGGLSAANVTKLRVAGAHDVAAGDLNIDGFIDLVFASRVEGGTASQDFATESPIFWGGADRTFTVARSTSLPTYGPTDVLIGALDPGAGLDVGFTSFDGTTATLSAYLYYNPVPLVPVGEIDKRTITGVRSYTATIVGP